MRLLFSVQKGKIWILLAVESSTTVPNGTLLLSGSVDEGVSRHVK